MRSVADVCVCEEAAYLSEGTSDDKIGRAGHLKL